MTSYLHDIFNYIPSLFNPDNVLEYLHNLYFGWIDIYTPEKVDTLCKFKHDRAIKETRSYTYRTTASNIIVRHTISTKFNNEAYTNFSITTSNGSLEELVLEITGNHVQQIEQLTNFTFLNSNPVFHTMSEGRALPNLDSSTIDVIITTKGDCEFTISYDVVSPIGYRMNEFYEDLIYQEQKEGPHILTNSIDTDIIVSYKVPIVQLYVHIPVDIVASISLIIDGLDYGLYFIKKDNYYVLTFGDKYSINFGRISCAVIKVVTKEVYPGTPVNIIGIGKRLMRMHNGMVVAI